MKELIDLFRVCCCYYYNCIYYIIAAVVVEIITIKFIMMTMLL